MPKFPGMLIRLVGASGDGERVLVTGLGAGTFSTGTICTALLVSFNEMFVTISRYSVAVDGSGSGELSPIFGTGGSGKGNVLGRIGKGFRMGG